jgi:hypothetical protein
MIPTRNATKKDMIAKILLDNSGKYSAREIAQMVGTTEANVFKEKSRLRATGLLTDERISVVSQSVGDETLTLARAEARTLITRSDFGQLTDLPPLRGEDLKKLYTEFQDGFTPHEVIARNGFSPVLVEYEYNRYIRMRSLNLKSIGKRLVTNLFFPDDEGLNLQKQKIEKDGIASNDDIEIIIRLIKKSGMLDVIERIRKGQYTSPCAPFRCSHCGEDMKGALYDPQGEIGEQYRRKGLRPMHEYCYNKSG